VAEDDALRRLEFFALNLDFVEMRLAIRPGVDSHDFHDSSLIKGSSGFLAENPVLPH
jgi:hypothetical protein